MFNAYNRIRFQLLSAAVVNFVLFWFVGVVFNIPAVPGQGASLLREPSPATALLITAVTLFVCTLLGTLIAGRIRFDAGLCTACVGLSALSIRGGPLVQLLHTSTGPDLYLTLAVELLALFAIVAICWGVLWALHAKGFLQADQYRDGIADTEHTPSQKIQAAAATVLILGVLAAFFMTTDIKAQAILGIGMAAFLATLAAHSTFAVRPSGLFWLSPLVVGLVAYAWAYMTPEGWEIGRTGVRMARALPIDYASAGVAGSIYGYWTSRRWQRGREAEAKAAAES